MDNREQTLKDLAEITEYFLQCHVNAAKHSAAARRFARYIIALDKARYAVRRLQESEAEEDDGK